MGRKQNPRRSGGLCFCRPRRPADTGVVLEAQTPQHPARSIPPGWNVRSKGAFLDELAAGSFSNTDLDWCVRDPTEPTQEEEAEDYTVEVEDPKEAWYRFWYSKGILMFVPQSIQEAEAASPASPLSGQRRSGGGTQDSWAAFPSAEGSSSWSTPQRERRAPPKVTAARSAGSSPAAKGAVARPKALPKSPRTADVRSRAVLEEAPAKAKLRKNGVESSSSGVQRRKVQKTPVQNPTQRAVDPSKRSARSYLAKPGRGANHPSTVGQQQPPVSRSQRTSTAATTTTPSVTKKRTSVSSSTTTPATQLPTPSPAPPAACAACGQPAKPSLRCPNCSTACYCSVFCKGSDRYKHAKMCAKAAAGNDSSTSPGTTGRRTTVPTSPGLTQSSPGGVVPAQSLRQYWEERATTTQVLYPVR